MTIESWIVVPLYKKDKEVNCNKAFIIVLRNVNKGLLVDFSRNMLNFSYLPTTLGPGFSFLTVITFVTKCWSSGLHFQLIDRRSWVPI